jgi:hypothetical protein
MLSAKAGSSGSGKLLKAAREEFLGGDVAAKRNFLMKLLADEIQVGFLMLFCENEYCTENMRFVVACSDYISNFRKDGNKWKSWEVLDRDPAKWEKQALSEDIDVQIQKSLEKMSAGFLSAHSRYEICISAGMIERTEKRMKNYKVYGPEVFKEACIDPMDTLIKDILPRFVVSDTFVDMEYFAQKFASLPQTGPSDFEELTASDLMLSAYQSQLLTESDVIEYCKDDVSMYFRDPLLYEYFFRYLKRIHAQENLLCVAQINRYNKAYEAYIRLGGLTAEKTVMKRTKAVELFSTAELFECDTICEGEFVNASVSEMRSEIIHQAWIIYLYFLAPGSTWEVSLSYHVHQIVSRTLACPAKDMFQDVKLEAMKIVNKEFESFINTAEFKSLLELVAKRQNIVTSVSPSSDAKGVGSQSWAACLGMGAKAESK